MAWYTVSGTPCLFALDFNSAVNNSTNNVKFSNSSSRSLTAYEPQVNAIRKETVPGIQVKNFSYLSPTSLVTYKTLRIDNKILIFDTPINFPNEFTLILKAKILSPIVILSADSYGYNYGPTLEGISTTSNEDLWHSWSFQGFSSGDNYSSAQKSISDFNGYSTMILKGNILEQTVKMITDYGTYNIPPESAAYQYFLQQQSFSIIGYSYDNENYLPNVNIVAFGLFSKEIPDARLNTLLAEIDTQFLVSSKNFSTVIGNATNSKINFSKVSSGTSEILKSTLKFYPYLKPQTKSSLNSDIVLDEKVIVENLSISELTDIKDFVYEEGIPVVTKLFLLKRQSGHLVAQTISTSTGYFEFKNLDKNLEYIVVSTDKKYQFKSILKDYDKRD